MQTRRARSRIEARRCHRRDHGRPDKHFVECGCRCHVAPAPAPHHQGKCASVSYVSLCSIVAIISISQSCALTIRALIVIRLAHLHYTHGARSTPRALAVPGRRVPSRYPTPRREACSRPGLTITTGTGRQLTRTQSDDLGHWQPLSGHFPFAENRHLH
jgi:hypothetical protein